MRAKKKKYPIKISDGSTIYVSVGKAKEVREAKRMASKIKGYLIILPRLRFNVVDKFGNGIIAKDSGYSLNRIREKLGETIAIKKQTKQ